MPNNDYKILWDVSSFDWREVEKRFQEKFPEEDTMFKLNCALNKTPLVVFSLLTNLNKRVEELEYELKELKSTQKGDNE